MKDRQKALRRSLWVSALAIVLCCAMLVGTTFAWFTDSVTSSGNKIEAGTLNITATAAGYDQNGGTEVTVPEGIIAGNKLTFGEAEDIEAEKAKPIISESNWEPGQRNAKLLTVTNSGSLAAKIKLEFNVSNGGLTDALWFDFIQVNENTATGQFTQRDMSTLNDLAGQVELPVPAGGSVSFILVYGMKESAGNEYQGKGFEASVNILAKQNTVEEDGFGNDQYDASAEYVVPVASPEELTQALANAKDGENLLFKSDINSTGNLDLRNVENIQIDFQKNTAAVDNNNISFRVIGSDTKRASATFSNGSIEAGEGTYCTVGASKADLTLNDMTLKNITAYGCSVKAFGESVITLNNVASSSTLGGAMEAAGGVIHVNGGTFTQQGKYDHNSCLGAVSGGTGTLNVRDMTGTGENYGFYIFSSGGTINVYSGSFKASTVLKADLDLNSYPTAEGTINVYGGSFDGKIEITDKCEMRIEAGSFKNTGLTLEQFRQYVAEDSVVSENDGVYTVTKS